MSLEEFPTQNTSRRFMDAELSWQRGLYVGEGGLGMLAELVSLCALAVGKTDQALVSRRLALAALTADLLHSLAFLSAGIDGLNNAGMNPADAATSRATSPCGPNDDDDNCSFGLNSLGEPEVKVQPHRPDECLRSFYATTALYAQTLTCLLALQSALERLTAVAYPLLYGRLKKSKRCWSVLICSTYLISLAGLIAVLAAGDARRLDRDDDDEGLWRHRSDVGCLAPFLVELGQTSKYVYGVLCGLVLAAVVAHLLALIACQRVVAGDRIAYPRRNNGDTDGNDVAAVRNANWCAANGVASPNLAVQRRAVWRLVARLLGDSSLLFFPLLGFWTTAVFGPSLDVAWRRRIAVYCSYLLAAYPCFNTLCCGVARATSARLVRDALLLLVSRCRRAQSVTTVETIGDEITQSTASVVVADNPRLTKKRPSILPLVYGTTQI